MTTDPNARARELARKIRATEWGFYTLEDGESTLTRWLLTYGRERWNAALEEAALLVWRCDVVYLEPLEAARLTAALRALKEQE